ncbi:hypothetical protein F0562_029626 [Nyssa sinensis]|uniref:Reverse transcriptase Ty1/copia-type domain-containing protein n=1 Tax=Nyssa sinensis TaxID=561372 RepID=A0A5J5B3G9_9ASTE|nr:hypothetical protein F0562_029626 [Nyssa sinensis]
MSEEYDALVRNGTWELVPPISASNIVGCKWIFRIKRHSDGSIDRFKARLVAKGATPVSTLLPTSPPISLHSGTPLPDPTEYRTVVGSMQYLSLTRPDISYAVNKLSQYMHQPSTEHWALVKRILRYLYGTLDEGVIFYRDTPLCLHAFSDADWDGNPDDFSSTSAYIVYLGRNLISWSSKKQNIVSRSSTEAEYCSVVTTAAELK